MSANALHSALYVGSVRHRRFAKPAHAFRARLFMVYLDLSELPRLFRGRWLWSARRPALAWFRREDHAGDPALPLDTAIRDLVQERTGERPEGPVRLLTHLRYWGYCFNPISVYYCFSADGERLTHTVLEVSNTPWGQRHCYVLPLRDKSGGNTAAGPDATFGKAFHVSPFMGMDHRYHLWLRNPARHLTLHLENRQAGRAAFDATLSLRREPLDGPSMAGVLLRHPFMTAQVIASIYWQALRLWMKGARYHAPTDSHPESSGAPHA